MSTPDQRARDRDDGTAAPVPNVVYGPPVTTEAEPGATGSRKGSKALVLVAVIVVITAIGSVVASVNSDIRTDSAQPAVVGEAEADVLSVGGYDDLVTAVESETGRTESFGAVLYPTYAVVELPVDATTQRETFNYWDGHVLRDQSSKSTSAVERFDLSSVDPAVVVRLIKKVRRLADDPTSWYAVVRAPDDSGVMIWAYATNEYNETVYVAARRNGKVVADSTKP